MSSLVRIMLIIGLAASTGCATTYRVDAHPQAGQELIFENGAPTLIAHGDTVSVVMSRRESATTPFDRLQFHIYIANRSAETITVTPHILAAEDSTGRLLEIPSREELVQEANRRAGWAAFAAAMSTAGAGNTYGPDGYSYDATAAQIAQARADAQIHHIASDRAETVNSLQSDYIANQTLRSGDDYLTTFSVEKPVFRDGAAEVTIAVNVEGETHSFRYRLERMK